MRAAEFLRDCACVLHGASKAARRPLLLAAIGGGMSLSSLALGHDAPAYTDFSKLSDVSQTLTASAGASGVTVISAEDPAAQSLIDDYFVARTRAAALSGNSDRGVAEKLGPDGLREGIEQGLSFSMTVIRGGSPFCLLNAGDFQPDEGDMGEAVRRGGVAESKLFANAHEFTHCMTTTKPAGGVGGNDPVVAVLYQEAVADVSAAMFVSSRTGSWDYAKYRIANDRFLTVGDPSHMTAPWLEKMTAEIDVAALPANLGLDGASKLAKEFVDSHWSESALQDWSRELQAGQQIVMSHEHYKEGLAVAPMSAFVLAQYKARLAAHLESMSYEGRAARSDLQVFINNVVLYASASGDAEAAHEAIRIAQDINEGGQPSFGPLANIIGAEPGALSASRRRNESAAERALKETFEGGAAAEPVSMVSPFGPSDSGRSRFLERTPKDGQSYDR